MYGKSSTGNEGLTIPTYEEICRINETSKTCEVSEVSEISEITPKNEGDVSHVLHISHKKGSQETKVR